MSTRFAQYNPRKVVITFKGIQMLMVAEGTFVVAERMEDGFTMRKGAYGDVTRVQMLDVSGSVTVTLQGASPTNDLLMTEVLADELAQTGWGPLQIKDLNGTTLLNAPIAWVRKRPNYEGSDDAPNREWVFDCHALLGDIGGAAPIL